MSFSVFDGRIIEGGRTFLNPLLSIGQPQLRETSASLNSRGLTKWSGAKHLTLTEINAKACNSKALKNVWKKQKQNKSSH